MPGLWPRNKPRFGAISMSREILGLLGEDTSAAVEGWRADDNLIGSEWVFDVTKDELWLYLQVQGEAGGAGI